MTHSNTDSHKSDVLPLYLLTPLHRVRRLSVFYTVTLHVVAEAMRRADGAIAGEVAITSPVAAQRRSPEEAHTRARGRVRRQNGAQGGTDQLSAAPS